MSLWAVLAVYFCASLIHFVHNAEYIAEYPNLPVWLTRSKVYLAWLVVTTVGAAGILALKLQLRALGLLTLGGYAALGFAGLDHYWVAPASAHTLSMNATIWFEVTAAAALLALVIGLLFRAPKPFRTY